MAFAKDPFGDLLTQSRGHLVGNSEQPSGDRFLLPHGIGLLQQDQERRLEGILRILLVAQDPATDAPNHRSMAVHQGSKGGLVTGGKEAGQERAVPVGEGQLAELFECLAQAIYHDHILAESWRGAARR